MTVSGFGERLAGAMADRGPLCLGIDPHPELLHAWGLRADAEGLAEFSDICVAAFGGFAVVKPQVAFFEAYGAAGFAVLERTIAALRRAGVLVLADAKRGDIGSTMAAYAQAWAGDSPLAADAVTASPYLGFGSLQPLLDVAREHGRGVFVLAATSNPEGASVQRARAGESTVAQAIVDAAAAANRDTGQGSVGVEERPLRTGQTAVLGAGDYLSVSAAARQDSRTPALDVVVLGGRPIREALAWAGPFVMNTRAEVMEAYQDFQSGRFGHVPA